MLSKVVSSTIFKVFGMTRPGIKPRSPRPLANTNYYAKVNKHNNNNNNNCKLIKSQCFYRFSSFLLFIEEYIKHNIII